MAKHLSRIFPSPEGTVAIDPESAFYVLGEGETCQIYLIGGLIITVAEKPETVAKTLWGYLNQTGDGFYNASRSIAVTSTMPGCCRVHFPGGNTLDLQASVEGFLASSRFAQEYRDNLDQAKKTKGD